MDLDNFKKFSKMENEVNKQKAYIKKNITAPFDSLGEEINKAGVMDGTIQKIFSHIKWRLRDFDNGKIG